jgi:hypothetical protein
MTYKLYRAKDTRDDSAMLWLHDTRTAKVAQFHTKTAVTRIKTAVTRIKRLTAVGPCAITWSPEGDLLKHGTDVRLIESWN